MLYVIGVGLKPKHLTIEALDALMKCDRVYLETYTSAYSSGSKEELEDIIEKGITELSRKQVEEEFSPIMEDAKGKNIALCVFGNPLSATTHVQLLLDAKEAGVTAKVLPGISIYDFIPFTGLDKYKFGRTTTLVFHEQEYEPESFYDTILVNKEAGLHTLCLLDIKKDEGKMMGIGHAIALLESIEEKRGENVVADSVIVGIAGAGAEKQQFAAGTGEQLKNYRFSLWPQCLVVCGKLSEKEVEALRALSGLE